MTCDDDRVAMSADGVEEVAVVGKGGEEALPGISAGWPASDGVALGIGEGVVGCHQGGQAIDVLPGDGVVELHGDRRWIGALRSIHGWTLTAPEPIVAGTTESQSGLDGCHYQQADRGRPFWDTSQAKIRD